MCRRIFISGLFKQSSALRYLAYLTFTYMYSMTFRLFNYNCYALMYIFCCHSMCYKYDCWGGFPASSVVGGSRFPRSGLFRVGLREHGHFGKVGLGFCPALFFQIALYSAGGDSVVTDLVSCITIRPDIINLSGSGMSR